MIIVDKIKNFSNLFDCHTLATHKLNLCWIHNDVHEDASVYRSKKPQWFIKDC